MPSPSLLFISVLLLLSGSFARPGSVLLSQPSSESVDKSEREALSHRNQVRDPFALEGLRRHNEKRALHGSPALTLDNRICLGAQAWANELAAMDSMRHSGSQFGENLFSLWGEACDLTQAAKAVDSWYSEINNYDFAKPGFHSSTGLFTQVVWRGSTKMCMARAKSDSHVCYVVANYFPRGNVLGEFDFNVPAVTPPRILSFRNKNKHPLTGTCYEFGHTRQN